METVRKTRKQATIDKLWRTLRLLDTARLSVIKQNEKGHQFDFVSDPRLSDVTDRITEVARCLNAVVYQKK